MTMNSPSPSMCVAASDAASKLGITLPASEAGAIIKAALAAAPTPSKLEPMAIQEAAKVVFAEARAALDETYHFASTSPGSQDNINLVLDKLDELEGIFAAVPSAPLPTAPSAAQPVALPLAKILSLAARVEEKVNAEGRVATVSRIVALTVATINEVSRQEGGDPDDERGVSKLCMDLLREMQEAPTMAAGYELLADFTEHAGLGTPVALQPAQGGSVTEALDHVRQFIAGMGRFADDHPISLGLEDGPEISLDGLDLDEPSPLTLGDLRALSAARASSPAAPEVVEAPTVSIPLETSRLINRAFLPGNPDRMRNAHPDVVQAAHDFKAALRAAGEAANG